VANTKFNKRDLNRFRKVYPYIRRESKFTFQSDSDAQIEVGEITFTDASSGTFTFETEFPATPIIVAISYDSESNDSADVNIFVTSVNTTSVTIDSSQNFTGKVQFHAIWINS
tara:strand:+ start:269 stop:607 length:339 start_codon:yes stop_codon:yes gene_type:complete